MRIELAAGLVLAGAAGGFLLGRAAAPAPAAVARDAGPSGERSAPPRVLGDVPSRSGARDRRRSGGDASDAPDDRFDRPTASRTRSEPPPLGGEPTSLASRVTPTARAGDPPVGEGRRRADALKAEADEALRQKDGKRALALVHDMVAIGEEADADVIDLVARLGRTLRDGEKIGFSSYDFDRLLRGDDMIPIEKRVILDPDADPRHRARAVDYLAQTSNGDTTSFVLSLLDQEKSGPALRGMLSYLDEQSDPQVGAALARSISGRANPADRQAIVESLSGAVGDDAQRALERTAAGDPDPGVRQAAHVALIERNPPVQGYLLTEIIPKSQAQQAGLAPGDIMLDYNGTPLGPQSDLRAARDGLKPGQPVTVNVWRDGQAVQVTLKAGQIGVNGRGIAPR